ncbi:MAG TPA: CPBP family intramembrane glutamic endopeptidase [Gemmatimonadales bacterium]|nr:CPBP family intramembrane glutamic endopeptidase [Gemmatimonadales bacterium]
MCIFLLTYEGLAHVLVRGLSRILPRQSLQASTTAHIPDSLIQASSPRPFGFRDGLTCLGLFVVAQLFVWVITGALAALHAGSGAPPAAIARETVLLAPVALPLSLALSGMALLLWFRRYVHRADWILLRRDLGLSWGRAASNGVAIIGGAGLAVLLLLLGPHLADPRGVRPGFVGSLAITPGPGRLAWIVTAIALAPVIEEILFRGVLLHSFRTALRLPIAAIATGFLFWLFHIPDALAWWPAAVAIALFATLITFIRIRSNALGPAISGHFAYNAVLVIMLFRAA